MLNIRKKLLKGKVSVLEWKVFGFIDDDDNIRGKISFVCHHYKDKKPSASGDCFILYRTKLNKIVKTYLTGEIPYKLMDLELFNVNNICLNYPNSSGKINLSLEFLKFPKITPISISMYKGQYWWTPFPIAKVIGRIRMGSFTKQIKGAGTITNSFIPYTNKTSLHNINANHVWNWTFFNNRRITFLIATGLVPSCQLLWIKMGGDILIFSEDQFILEYQWKQDIAYPEIVTVTARNNQAEVEIVNRRLASHSIKRAYAPYFDFIKVKGTITKKYTRKVPEIIEFSGIGFHECKGAKNKKTFLANKENLKLPKQCIVKG